MAKGRLWSCCFVGIRECRVPAWFDKALFTSVRGTDGLAFLGRTPEDLADLPWTTCHQGASTRSGSIVADRADAPNACRRFDVGLVIVWLSR